MNCRPGDLAVICGEFRRNSGHFVEVLRLDFDLDWECIALSSLLTNQGLVDRGALVSIDDASLRPIRDPGDDAQDEMLRPLPSELERT